ncbi:hypothetical protein GOP47_0024413 [Adiantum capillus-veneris]|uniref:Uncharacterized protein n=1 Tax=Adiantum capillus-veneris TaxID=13818 RepID=A0A9D4Z2R2_ADICA|nr:hypothetical protein GOP47_0024413 [Adiantum capillus-veneris]
MMRERIKARGLAPKRPAVSLAELEQASKKARKALEEATDKPKELRTKKKMDVRPPVTTKTPIETPIKEAEKPGAATEEQTKNLTKKVETTNKEVEPTPEIKKPAAEEKGKEKDEEEVPPETPHPLQEELNKIEGERAAQLMIDIALEQRSASPTPTLQPITLLETPEFVRTKRTKEKQRPSN